MGENDSEGVTVAGGTIEVDVEGTVLGVDEGVKVDVPDIGGSMVGLVENFDGIPEVVGAGVRVLFFGGMAVS